MWMFRSNAWAIWLVLGLVPIRSLQEPGTPSAESTKQAESSRKQSPGQTVEPNTAAPRPGYLVQISLPITASVQEQVEATLRRIAEDAPTPRTAAERAVVVLEFDTSNGRDGRGSRFGSCTDLARFLISNELSRLELVAYIPAPKGFLADSNTNAAQPQSKLVGHAVLVALACNHVVMHRDSAIGQAGIDEPAIDEGLRNTYRQMAAKRLAFPVEFAVSLLDPNASLYRADLGDGKFRFVDREQLQALEKEGKVVQTDTLTEQGSLPLYSAELLAKFQLLKYKVTSRRDIAERFRLNPGSLEGDPTLGGQWNAVKISLTGRVDHRTVNWISNALAQLPGKTNLIIVSIDSDGGDAASCMRLAEPLGRLRLQQGSDGGLHSDPGTWERGDDCNGLRSHRDGAGRRIGGRG